MGTSCIILDIRPGSQSLFPPLAASFAVYHLTLAAPGLWPHTALPQVRPGALPAPPPPAAIFPPSPFPSPPRPSPPPHRSRGRDSLPSRPFFPPLREGARSRGSSGAPIRALRSGLCDQGSAVGAAGAAISRPPRGKGRHVRPPQDAAGGRRPRFSRLLGEKCCKMWKCSYGGMLVDVWSLYQAPSDAQVLERQINCRWNCRV